MADKLVIVESPAKAKTIQKYLGRGFRVEASMGHVRDLPKNDLGVDIDHDFEPVYEVAKGKEKIVAALRKSIRQADAVYLATDPDREGEAIAWHITQATGIPRNTPIYRVEFSEITRNAVQQAIAHPRQIDRNLVDAQQARRVLDRLVGYKLSPLLWEKVRRGLSAGRVQSVAVRLITEREREVQAFVPVEYWSLHARLRGQTPPDFVATLKEVRGQKAELPSESATLAVMTALHGTQWKVKAVTRGERRRNPTAPFITSTLQQEAGRKLHFTAKKTMMLAQQLYEGIALGAEGLVGLITYMRTDAVRPTSVAREPKAIARFLTKDQLALYRLVWERFLASQMLPAVYDTVTADIEAGQCLFRAQGSTLRFPGFMAVYVESREESVTAPEEESESVVPPLEVGELLKLLALDPKQHFTQPPPRYTEASLVKTLEERGIGRPSTYAQIMSTIQDRGYVHREKGTLFPTDLGMQVNDLLVPHFPEVMDVEFTAQLEESLDKIEDGDADWVDTVQTFYKQFSRDLKSAGKTMENIKAGTETGEPCPECGKPLVKKFGRFGSFLACSAYPECKYTKDLGGGREKPADEPTDETCPTCGKPMVVKHGRFGKFIACSGYPECKTTKPLSLGIDCPEPGCGGQLVERRTKRGKTFFSCTNYPTCKFALWARPVREPCPRCAAPFTTERVGRGGKVTRSCIRQECGYKQEIAPTVVA